MKKKTPTYNMTWPQIEAMKKEEREKAISFAFNEVLLIVLLVLRDNYKFGPKRMEEFIDNTKEMLDQYNKEEFSLDEIAEVLEEELGIKVRWE